MSYLCSMKAHEHTNSPLVVLQQCLVQQPVQLLQSFDAHRLAVEPLRQFRQFVEDQVQFVEVAGDLDEAQIDVVLELVVHAETLEQVLQHAQADHGGLLRHRLADLLAEHRDQLLTVRLRVRHLDEQRDDAVQHTLHVVRLLLLDADVQHRDQILQALLQVLGLPVGDLGLDVRTELGEVGSQLVTLWGG